MGCFLLLLAAIHPQEPSFEVEWGASRSTGDYGTGSDIDVLSVYSRFLISNGPWEVSLTLPHNEISAIGNVVSGGVGPPGGGPPPTPPGQTMPKETSARETSVGLGDLVLDVSYRLGEALYGLGVVKFPTGDEDRNLGTGEWDTGLGLAAERVFGGVEWQASVIHMFMGGLRNAWAVALQGTIPASSAVEIFASVVWQESVVSGIDNGLMFGAGVEHRRTDGLGFRAEVMAGLSDGAPQAWIACSLIFSRADSIEELPREPRDRAYPKAR